MAKNLSPRLTLYPAKATINARFLPTASSHHAKGSLPMPSMNRREFLYDTTALAAMLAGAGMFSVPVAPARAAGKKKGDANDKLHVAVIGVHGRGMSHVGAFANTNGGGIN